eukprot:scaffold7994_cov123-Cylindrotheca_fusiformis.AAC.4
MTGQEAVILLSRRCQLMIPRAISKSHRTYQYCIGDACHSPIDNGISHNVVDRNFTDDAEIARFQAQDNTLLEPIASLCYTFKDMWLSITGVQERGPRVKCFGCSCGPVTARRIVMN